MRAALILKRARLLALTSLLTACAQASPPQSTPITPLPIALSAQIIPLQEGNAQLEQVGGWRYLGGLALRSSDRRFGGLSALRITAQGRALALSDQGDWIGFKLIEKQGRLIGVENAVRVPLLDVHGQIGQKPERDAEALELDQETQQAWVTLERRNQIWRFAGFNPDDPKSWARPAAQEAGLQPMLGWPGNGGAEAFVRLEDGRLLVFSEEAVGVQPGTLQVLLVDARLGKVLQVLSYQPPEGFKPTDAVRIGDALLLLNRRFSLAQGVSVALTTLLLNAFTSGQVLQGQEVLRLSAPFSVDNFEGVSVVEQNGQRYVYIVSDDNFNQLQRTLLLKFSWKPL
jgi:hypothetical protein